MKHKHKPFQTTAETIALNVLSAIAKQSKDRKTASLASETVSGLKAVIVARQDQATAAGLAAILTKGGAL